jgi:Zn-dependent oligopeptidase
MLANTTYPVYLELLFIGIVELPSQMETGYEPEALALFIKQYETENSSRYVEKIKKVQVFRRNGNIRQISFGLLDMTYHEKTKH